MPVLVPLDIEAPESLDQLHTRVNTMLPDARVEIEAYDLRRLIEAAAGQSEQMSRLQYKLDDEQAATGEIGQLVAKFELGNAKLIADNEDLKELLDHIRAECEGGL